MDFRKLFEFIVLPLIREMSKQKIGEESIMAMRRCCPFVWYHAFNNEFSDHVKLIFTHLLLFCRHMFPRLLLFSSLRGKYITKDPLLTFKTYLEIFLPKALVGLQLRTLWLSGFDKEPTTFSSCCIFNELHLTVCLRWTWTFCTLDWKQRVNPVMTFNEWKYFFMNRRGHIAGNFQLVWHYLACVM